MKKSQARVQWVLGAGVLLVCFMGLISVVGVNAASTSMPVVQASDIKTVALGLPEGLGNVGLVSVVEVKPELYKGDYSKASESEKASATDDEKAYSVGFVGGGFNVTYAAVLVDGRILGQKELNGLGVNCSLSVKKTEFDEKWSYSCKLPEGVRKELDWFCNDLSSKDAPVVSYQRWWVNGNKSIDVPVFSFGPVQVSSFAGTGFEYKYANGLMCWRQNWADTITIDPTLTLQSNGTGLLGDTYIRYGAFGDTNYGTSAPLLLGNGDLYYKRIYFTENITNITGTVVSANCSLYQYDRSYATTLTNCSIYHVFNHSINYATVTWNTGQPCGSTLGNLTTQCNRTAYSVPDSPFGTGTMGWKTFVNLSGAFEYERLAGATNITFLVMCNETGTSENNAYIYSSEGSSSNSVKCNVAFNTTAPGSNQYEIVTLNQPASGTSFPAGLNNVSLNFTVNGSNSTYNCSLRLNNTLNQSGVKVGNNTLSIFNVSGIGWGFWLWNVTCSANTTLYNTSATWNFTTSNTLPAPWVNVALNQPISGSNMSNNLTLNYTVTGTNSTYNVSLNLNGSVNNQTGSGKQNNTLYSFSIWNLSAGFYRWNVTAWINNTVYNTSQTWNFTVANAPCVVGVSDCSSCSGWVYINLTAGGSIQVRDNDGNGKYDQSCCGGTVNNVTAV